jgi:hypothetical protein
LLRSCFGWCITVYRGWVEGFYVAEKRNAFIDWLADDYGGTAGGWVLVL